MVFVKNKGFFTRDSYAIHGLKSCFRRNANNNNNNNNNRDHSMTCRPTTAGKKRVLVLTKHYTNHNLLLAYEGYWNPF